MRRLPLAGDALRGLRDEPRPEDLAARPRYVVWELTLRCDLACHHCSSRAGRPRSDELTTAEAVALVDQLADLGTLQVTLIGGEAYLHEGWTEVVRAVRARGMECTMVTGGRGMSAERARQASDAGLQSVSVSIDGTEATHDALRALKGSHAAALAAMENLADAGVQVSGNTQVGRANRRELASIFGTLRDHGAHSWQIQVTVAGGRAADDPAILLEPYQLLEVMPSLARLKPAADAADVRLWPGNNLGYYGPYEALLRGDVPGMRKGSCPAGRTVLGVESNGALKGCPSLPSAAYVGGSVRDHAVKDVWERTEPLAFTRDHDARRAELYGYCGSCYYADDCLGGCSWTAHSLLGKRGDNPYCHHRALDLLRRGLRERVEREVAPQGVPFDFGRFAIVTEAWSEAALARANAVAAGREEWLLD